MDCVTHGRGAGGVRRYVAAIASAVAFAAGLLLACGALGRIRPFAGAEQMERKFSYFASHLDDFDTLFFGSSRVRMGIDPRQFDAATAAAGVPTKSFNFGIDAMCPPQDSFVAERIFALHPTRLKTVFIEITRLPVGFAPPGDQPVYWRDGTRTALKLRMIFDAERLGLRHARHFSFRLARRRIVIAFSEWPLVSSTLTQFLERTANLGRGSLLLAGLDASIPPPPPDPLEVATGFHHMLNEPGRGAARRLLLFDKNLAAVKKHPARPVPLNGPEEDNLLTILTCVRRSGARPVLVIMPQPDEAYYPRDVRAAPILDFSSPYLWPDLYLRDERLDHAHLNAAGARRFSQTLAECWAPLQKTHPHETK